MELGSNFRPSSPSMITEVRLHPGIIEVRYRRAAISDHKYKTDGTTVIRKEEYSCLCNYWYDRLKVE